MGWATSGGLALHRGLVPVLLDEAGGPVKVTIVHCHGGGPTCHFLFAKILSVASVLTTKPLKG